jgi:peptidoglycan glycosyltransferase
VNRHIRYLGVGLLACFVALFIQLNNIQLYGQERLENDPLNTRDIIRDFGESRGVIATSDGVVLARSIDVGGQLQREREYPEGDLYGHVTGFFSFDFGATGIEETYNDELAGRTVEQQFGSFSDLFKNSDTSGNVQLTLDSRIQAAARDGLAGRRGSVVALDPRDGSILAMYSNPTYDPNPISSTDLEEARTARVELLEDPENPALARSYRERFAPGSTFKTVTAGAGLDSGLVTTTEPVFPFTDQYVPPLTTVPIRNFGGSSCGGALPEILVVSCNTAFAEMGAEVLGPDIMVDGAEAFGFNAAPPIDLPDPAESVFPTDFDQDTPRLAQASIGQNDVAATPLEMALVASAPANGGLIMRPHVMGEIRDQDGRLIDEWSPSVWRAPLGGSDADTLRQLMIDVVERGTARAMQIPGFLIGAKTGTAQTNLSVETGGVDDTHAWMIAFGGSPGAPAEVALAVILEAVPGGGQQTGGVDAAPVARAVMEAALTR